MVDLASNTSTERSNCIFPYRLDGYTEELTTGYDTRNTLTHTLVNMVGQRCRQIKPQGKKMNAGKVVSRFTNVWIYSNNSWSMTPRHGTIIKVESKELTVLGTFEY